MSRGEKKLKGVFMLAALLIGAGVFLFGASVSAQPLQLFGRAVGLDCNWAAGETFGLGAFTKLALNVLKLIWGILGSLALVMFVWGGFLWLTARGEENQIKQGWDTLINAVIGLLIVLGSWLIINTIILALTDPGNWTHVAKVFNEDWTNRVEGDICVKVGAHVKSTGIGKGAAGSSATPGGCCYDASANPEFQLGDIDHCKKLANTFDNVWWCPGATAKEACGEEKWGTVGGRKVWADVQCGGNKKKITVVDKEEVCGEGSDTIRLCRESYSCISRFGNDSRTFCLKEDEEKGSCLFFYDLTDLVDVAKKEVVTETTKNITRADCKQTPAKSGNGAVKTGFSTQYADRLFCPDAASINVGGLTLIATIAGGTAGCAGGAITGAIISALIGGVGAVPGCLAGWQTGAGGGAVIGALVENLGTKKCIKP